MRNLLEEELTVVQEVIDGPGWLPGRPGLAWTPRSRLELVGGIDLVEGLIEAGWLDDWPDNQAVTLSALGAARMGVRLEERQPDEAEVWVPINEPEPPIRCDRRIIHLPCLDFLPTPVKRREESTEFPRLSGGVGRQVTGILGQAQRRRGPGRCLARARKLHRSQPSAFGPPPA